MRPETGLASIEGVRPILEALRAGRRRVIEIAVPPALASPGLRELVTLAAERGIPISRGPRPDARVVARADPYPEEPFEALLVDATARFLVALDGVTDVGNLGAIARTAEAAGATGLVLEHRRSPPIEAGALRASAGALEYLRVGRTPNLPRALALAASEGLAILVADLRGTPIGSIPASVLRGDLVWVFGSEDQGVREAVRGRASARVCIPQAGRVASLGVSAAAAYLLLRTSEVRRPEV